MHCYGFLPFEPLLHLLNNETASHKGDRKIIPVLFPYVEYEAISLHIIPGVFEEAAEGVLPSVTPFVLEKRKMEVGGAL